MADWGTSSFVEATIGINMVSAFWGPVVAAFNKIPGYFEAILRDWSNTLRAKAPESDEEAASASVINHTAKKCQKIVNFYKSFSERIWRATSIFTWLSVLMGLGTLYFGCENPLTVFLLLPIFLYIILCFIVGSFCLIKMRCKMFRASLTTSDISEAAEKEAIENYTEEIESDSGSDRP